MELTGKSGDYRAWLTLRFIVPALLTLLPILTVGGVSTNVGSGNSSAAPLPGTSSDDALANKYDILVMRVYFKDIAERDALAFELIPEETPTIYGYLTVIRDRTLYRDLKARGIHVEIDERQSSLFSDPSSLPDTFFGGYRTVEEIYQYLDDKVAAHPTLAQKIDIGDSWCKTNPGSCTLPAPFSGYDLVALHITNQAIPGPKPVFWADGGIHAREIATPEVIMRFIDWLLDNYNTNADARWLVDYHDIWLMPTVNPDGHHIVESGEAISGAPYYYRKNANNTLGSSCAWPPTPFDHFGVDNNRNFPFKWGCCGGASGNPCAQTYRGSSPGGEVETMAITTKLSELIPDQRGPGDLDAAPITTTGIYQGFHTNGEINLVPWGWSPADTPNAPEMLNFAAHVSAADAGGNNYPYRTISGGGGVLDGGAVDWTYGELGIASMLTELGGFDFFIDYSCIDNPGCSGGAGLWPENKGALIYQAKLARTPYLLTHGPDANMPSTLPITATVGDTAILTSTLNFAWANNAFAQNVGAAEYYIDTPPWAGGTALAMTAIDGAFDSPTEGAQASIDTTSLSIGRHIVFVRGRGASDFSGFQTWGPISAAFLDVMPIGTPTFTPTPTNTPTPTGTATNTSLPTFTQTSTHTGTPLPATATTTTTATSTACPIRFTDVPESSTFYAFVRCLACRGMISGYDSGCETGNPCFRPGSSVTRGQLAKIVSNAAGFDETPGAQQFEDVPPGSTFFEFVWRLADREIVSGYPCGGPGEPCGGGNLPYFRPGNNITRGQIAKIVSEAADYNEPVGVQQFEDVPVGSTFYDYIWRLTDLKIMEGYPCGGPGEPCGGGNLPYFRPGNNATRGQASKIVSNTFFPGCVTP